MSKSAANLRCKYSIVQSTILISHGPIKGVLGSAGESELLVCAVVQRWISRIYDLKEFGTSEERVKRRPNRCPINRCRTRNIGGELKREKSSLDFCLSHDRDSKSG